MNSNSTLEKSTTVVANPEQVSSALGGESVILSLQSGTYYGLNEVGTSIWKLVQQPISIVNLCDEIMLEFEIDPVTCEVEVTRLITELIEANLVAIQREKS